MRPSWCVIPLILIMLSACGAQRSVPGHSGTPTQARNEAQPLLRVPPALTEAEPSSTLFDGSIYDLRVQLRDQDGRSVSLDVFRGHPVLITMFYSSCTNACPLLMSDLKRLEQQLEPATRDRVRVLMISFDSARDTPEVLARHARERGIDVTRWKLASAPDETAREISAVLGIRYRKLDNGVYFHTSAIVLLDEQGRPRARADGLGKDSTSIVMALR